MVSGPTVMLCWPYCESNTGNTGKIEPNQYYMINYTYTEYFKKFALHNSGAMFPEKLGPPQPPNQPTHTTYKQCLKGVFSYLM